MCVETLRKGLDFTEMNDFRSHMPRFTLNMNVVSSISSGNPINVC